MITSSLIESLEKLITTYNAQNIMNTIKTLEQYTNL